MPMTDTLESIECLGCGSQLNEGDSVCPECGDTRRAVHVNIVERVIACDGLGLKGRRPGQKKPFVEEHTGPSFSRSRKKHVHRTMVIDRENDRYVEKVTDYESDEVIHQCEEQLSQHQGHGSAKGRKQKH